jgi:rfaE bifunctional protein kinase chain/domain
MPKYNLQEVNSFFEKIKNLNIVIIGDVMIDSYLWGNVDRISPEAPVPIVVVNKRANRLGGAANVALNVKAMGATPVLCSVIGQDKQAEIFVELLLENKLLDNGILKNKNRITTTKFRVIGNNMQMLRVDEEMDAPLSRKDQHTFLQNIQAVFTQYRVDAVVFQDYDKGVISPDLIKKVRELCFEKKIPITVDPKKRNFNAFRNLTLFKPNLKELREGLGVNFPKNDFISLRKAVRKLHQKQNLEIILATLSDAGVFISRWFGDHSFEDFHIPAHLRSIADVSGAGDTVISLATLCLALNLKLDEIAAISNLGGGQVCESLGVVPVNPEKLKKEMLSLEF